MCCILSESSKIFLSVSHQYLEDLFKNFCWAIFEAIQRTFNVEYWGYDLEIIPECLAANLEKVWSTSVWQTVAKFWFIWLWYISFCIVTRVSPKWSTTPLRQLGAKFWGTIKKTNKSEHWNHLSYRGLPYFF